MIKGVVNEALEASIRLAVRRSDGSFQGFDAVIDTGFNGFLTLPPAAVADLELTWLCRQDGELADGSIHVFEVYSASVAWFGSERLIEVEAADAQPLIGMRLMLGHDLQIHVAPGGAATLSIPTRRRRATN